MELEGIARTSLHRNDLTMQRNKVYSVTVISAVAQQLGVEEDLLHEISIGMEPEDGVIRVCGLSDDNDISIRAFTDDGIDELKNLLEMHRESSDPIK